MYDPVAAQRSAVYPYGQPANSPQVIVNMDPVPAAIVAYYQANAAYAAPETVVNVPIIAQSNASNYTYMSLNIDANGEMFECHGTVDSTFGVNEVWRMLVPFGARFGLIYGALPSAGSISEVQYGLDQAQQTAALIINRSSTLTIDGISAPRGLVSQATSAVNTAGIGAETVTLTSSAFTYKKGRAYRWITVGSYNQSAAGFWIQNIRYSLAGALVGQMADTTTPASGPYRYSTGVFTITSADQLLSLVQTMAFVGAGTITVNANGISVRSLYIYDIGAASDYAGEPAF